ncbi:MAG: PrsW family intramembrane metalloprotease [Bacteroidales bacterium]|nr:PrsW family intramembrane metalloprotease [Bacteroidales bacterium]
MQTYMILALLQAPILMLIFNLFLKFKFRINNWKLILQAIFFSLATVLSLFILDSIVRSFGYAELRNLKRSAFYSFVVIGAGSELGKFVLLRYYFLRTKSVTGPLGCIIYSIIISLGFSTVAVPLYLFGGFSNIPNELMIFTFPLANVVFATISGFFIGLGKQRKNRFIDSMTGLGAASFFHGFYYFANLTSDRTILLLFGIGIFFIAALLGVKSVNMKHNEEEENNND